MSQETDQKRQTKAALTDSEEKYRRLKANIPGMVYEFIMHPDGTHSFPYVNGTSRELFDITPEDLMRDATLITRLIHPDDQERFESSVQLSAETLQPWREILRHIVNGEVRFYDCMSRPELQPNGDILWDGIILEVTDRMKTLELLRANEQKLSRIISASPIGIGIYDGSGQCVQANDSLAQIIGATKQQVLEQNYHAIESWKTSGLLDVAKTVVKTEAATRHEVELMTSFGKLVFIDCHLIPFSTKSLLFMVQDITERKRAEQRAENLAYYDALTELPNRLKLQDQLCQGLAMAHREKFPLAVMMIDLDHFKAINDSLGHTVGDGLLRQVARRLLECVRKVDTISRMGGDEFVAVLLNADMDGAATVAERMLKYLGEPYDVSGHRINTTPSIGISVFPNDGQDREKLIKQADVAMYHAKDNGRNNYQFFTAEMNKSVMERILLENGLREALERNEMVLHYQPQIDTVSRRILGAEALLRWNHPEKGLIQPGRFIPVAEDSGLIVPIGAWVIREVCRQIRAWQDDGLHVCRISINLAARQLRDLNLVDSIRAALDENNVDPHLLEFELTESTLMIDSAIIDRHLQELARLGVELSIDDFGVGYSNLSYLKRFSFNRLKIDRSFVQDLPNDIDDTAIVSAVISLSHALNMQVVAEGVETLEQLALLQTLGCSAAQGFLFSKPLPSKQFAAYLRE